MTASLPLEVQQVFDSFLTTEFTTVDSRGRPICWPLTPYYEQGDPCIDVTTALGYPKKAEDARANPKVSLLFSDPTGSGMDAAPQVLVQGTADVDARDLEANRKRYTREALEKLPGSKDMMPPKSLQRLFSFYYTRLYIHVRPERVYVWPGGDPKLEPQLFDARMEEVRSGHDEEPPAPHAVHRGRAAGLGRAHGRARRALPERRAVARGAGRLSLLGAGPDLGRSGGAPGPARRRRARRAGPARPRVRDGSRPRPDFSWQRNFQVRGDLVEEDGGWVLVPQRMVGGLELPPVSKLAALPDERPQHGALLAQGKKNETRT